MMDLEPVTLGIARHIPTKTDKSRARKSSAAAADKIPEDLKNKILARDEHTCRCCGFKADKYQQILIRNQNKADLREDNLMTACIFCHQCFNLEDVSEMRSGVLIWLPEIEQAQLHHIARAIYVGRISQGPTADAARKALEILMQRREEAKNRVGTDRPYILAMVLRDYLGPRHYHYRGRKLDGLRLMPLDRRIIKEAELEFNQFPQILAYWRSKAGPFGGKTPPQWAEIYQRLKEQKAA